jgi:hypothetical protein
VIVLNLLRLVEPMNTIKLMRGIALVLVTWTFLVIW